MAERARGRAYGGVQDEERVIGAQPHFVLVMIHSRASNDKLEHGAALVRRGQLVALVHLPLPRFVRALPDA